MTDQAIESFCRQVRARSQAHSLGMERLSDLAGLQVSILRQELDSMVRVIFILAQTDRSYRNRLLEDSLNGKRWKRCGNNGWVTDREMVDLAQNFQGWTKSVYKFGCAFIHLSNMHDFMERDPLTEVSEDDRNSILTHLRKYHNGQIEENPTFSDVIPYLPEVFKKVAGNLECYLEDLEQNNPLL